jgi:signal transduction histidine kinase
MEFSPFRLLLREKIEQGSPALKRWLTVVTCALVAFIGLADFLLGFEVSLLVFYFVPIALAVFVRGWRFGVGVALACVTTWIAGDLAAGAHFASSLVPVWNAVIALLTYFVFIGLFESQLTLQRHLEMRVRQRTAALAGEIAERERLEKAILEIGERERRSTGRDLHDGLGQHLTGTALTGQLLVEKLQERAAPETGDAKRLVALITAAIAQTRQMAKGLLLADIDQEGLPGALQEFCAGAAVQFRVRCAFLSEGPVSLPEAGVASHLYRIAQESVRNAIRHGQAKQVEVNLRATGDRLILTVRDDGDGLPPPAARGKGLGLRIMTHRAQMIGATFTIETPPTGGTKVVCTLPLPAHD